MFYFSQSSLNFFRDINTNFFAAIKDKLAKNRKPACTNPTFFMFTIRIPHDAMCCGNVRGFHQRKFKKITNKAIKSKIHLFGHL